MLTATGSLHRVHEVQASCTGLFEKTHVGTLLGIKTESQWSVLRWVRMGLTSSTKPDTTFPPLLVTTSILSPTTNGRDRYCAQEHEQKLR